MYIRKTFLLPVWDHTLYFSLLTASLVVLWLTAMIWYEMFNLAKKKRCIDIWFASLLFSTYSSKTLRRSIFFIGIICMSLIAFQTGWRATDYINNGNITDLLQMDMWLFEKTSLSDSSIWFNALIQVIFSTSIGFGSWPVLTGKFLYKGDAVRLVKFK